MRETAGSRACDGRCVPGRAGRKRAAGEGRGWSLRSGGPGAAVRRGRLRGRSGPRPRRGRKPPRRVLPGSPRWRRPLAPPLPDAGRVPRGSFEPRTQGCAFHVSGSSFSFAPAPSQAHFLLRRRGRVPARPRLTPLPPLLPATPAGARGPGALGADPGSAAGFQMEASEWGWKQAVRLCVGPRLRGRSTVALRRVGYLQADGCGSRQGQHSGAHE